MKQIYLMLSIFLIFVCILNVSAMDEKKIQKEKQIKIQKMEKKAGLGVIISNFDDEEKTGVRIIEILKGSEAENIGLKKDDVITEINGKTVNKTSDFLDIVKDSEEGDELQLTVLRDGNKKNFTAKLKPFESSPRVFHLRDDNDDVYFDWTQPHSGKDNYTIVRPIMETDKGGYLGVKVKELSEQLKEYFEVKKGVLVEEVLKDSPAEKAGIKAGDIITAVNERQIDDNQDLIRTINYFNPDEKVEVKLVRKGGQKKVSVKLDQKPAPAWSTKMHTTPGKMLWIDDDDQEHVIIEDEGNDLKKFKVRKNDTMGDEEKIEIQKDYLIF